MGLYDLSDSEPESNDKVEQNDPEKDDHETTSDNENNVLDYLKSKNKKKTSKNELRTRRQKSREEELLSNSSDDNTGNYEKLFEDGLQNMSKMKVKLEFSENYLSFWC